MFIKNNSIKVNIFMSSSFKVNINERYKIGDNYLAITKKKNKLILCKNFIYLLFVLRLLKNFKDVSFFTMPKTKKNHKSVLRPPYKNKISRHSIGTDLWKINLSFKINDLKIINFNDVKSLLNFNKKLFFNFSFLETNIANQKKLKFNFNFFFNENFKLKNYNI